MHTHRTRRHCNAFMMTDCQCCLGCTEVLLPCRATCVTGWRPANSYAWQDACMNGRPVASVAARRGRTCDMPPSCPISAMFGSLPASPCQSFPKKYVRVAKLQPVLFAQP